MTMTHPGLPLPWILMVVAVMVFASLWLLLSNTHTEPKNRTFSLIKIPFFGQLIQRMVRNHWLLLGLKLVMVGFFLLVIVAGLFGTQIPERNFATIVTWNLWWAGLVFSILLLGSAWCAICPWDAIAQWLVRRRLWLRAKPNNSLNLSVPAYLKTVWPALFLFIALTWLELGVGTTVNPYATAIISLLMVLLATASLSIFKRKAFCHHFCPVGRTIGFYSQLSTIELRPVQANVCADCTTLECFHGNAQVDPCPTGLVMGSLQQSTYCTSCGNCSQSCPHDNVAWRLREPSVEAVQSARPHWDEAWFMVVLLALTAFHGITMLASWETGLSDFARWVNDSGQLLLSFSIGLLLCIAAVTGLYSGLIFILRHTTKTQLNFRQSFAAMSFVSLPLAFGYHMAHNLNHLIREGAGMLSVFSNPLGLNTVPLTMAEKHQRHVDMLISQDTLFLLQTLLMTLGVVIAIRTIHYRGKLLLPLDSPLNGLRLSPLLSFVLIITSLQLWMLMQPMIMRM